jgi:hypothetical protein
VAGIPTLTLPPILNAISFAYPYDHVVWCDTSCPDFTPRGSEPLAENSEDGRHRHCTRSSEEGFRRCTPAANTRSQPGKEAMHRPADARSLLTRCRIGVGARAQLAVNR